MGYFLLLPTFLIIPADNSPERTVVSNITLPLARYTCIVGHYKVWSVAVSFMTNKTALPFS